MFKAVIVAVFLVFAQGLRLEAEVEPELHEVQQGETHLCKKNKDCTGWRQVCNTFTGKCKQA